MTGFAKGRRVVCSAIRYGKMIVCGVRHHDMLMNNVAMAVDPANIFDWEQGFVDNRGVWMDRIEALAVAQMAGQIVKKHNPVDILFSEDFIVGYNPEPT